MACGSTAVDRLKRIGRKVRGFLGLGSAAPLSKLIIPACSRACPRACWLRVLAPEQRSVGFALRVRRVFGVVVVGPYGLEEVSAVEPHHGPDSRRTHFEYWLDQVHRPARALIDALRLIVVLCHAVPRFASFWFI